MKAWTSLTDTSAVKTYRETTASRSPEPLALKDEAERRDVSVAQLLRENTLRDLRAEAS
jgi:hypothetical protein